jgi:hypothetical protein
MKENVYSQRMEPARFRFFDEVEIPTTGIQGVLFTDHIEIRGGDGLHWVYLGLADPSSTPPVVFSVREVTDQIPVFTDFPGNFLVFDGRLTAFAISPGVPGIHANLWALLAGTGSISGATDLFFRVEQGGQLTPILTLRDTSGAFRVGVSGGFVEESRIHIGDLDGDGVAEIVVRSDACPQAPEDCPSPRSELRVYRLSEGRYLEVPSAEEAGVRAILRGMQPLNRSPRIRPARVAP